MKNKDLPTEWGPVAFENWRCHLTDPTCELELEYLLYSDSSIVGDIVDGFGPYRLLHIYDDSSSRGLVHPVLALQCAPHPGFGIERDAERSARKSGFHGGDISEEIAALFSLLFGIRLRPGPISRVFGDKEPKGGRPCHDLFGSMPRLSRMQKLPMLPFSRRRNVLLDLGLVGQYHKLDMSSATALARAARSYQNAVWIADDDPNLAWLLLISAVEVAAEQWRTSQHEDPVRVLQAIKPEWTAKLEQAGEELLKYFAKEWSKLLNATQRFVEFIKEFFPGPPAERPSPPFQFAWDVQSVDRPLRKLYEHRSNALHGGIPFPGPLCGPPIPSEYGEVTPEVVTGSTIFSLGGTWQEKDMPMRLHVFEHMARGAILKWWERIARLPKA
jgi:hypothetical protein